MFSPFLESKLKQIFNTESLDFLTQGIPQSIRVNTMKISENDLILRLNEKEIETEKINWVKYGYYIKKSPFSLGATTEYLLGYYFLQDPASMYACEVLEPEGMVLDMAAAPGGKTTYLSQLMGGNGCIIAIEINKERIRSLKSNINRMGAENVIAIRMDSLDAEKLGLKFDRILLDAPCTGTGTMHKNIEARIKTEKDVERCTSLQRKLIRVAIKLLKEGGILVYCTCSVLPEENEFIVAEVLDEGVILEEVEQGVKGFTKCYDMELPRELEKTKRFYPTLGTQGFFIAKLRKEKG